MERYMERLPAATARPQRSGKVGAQPPRPGRQLPSFDLTLRTVDGWKTLLNIRQPPKPQIPGIPSTLAERTGQCPKLAFPQCCSKGHPLFCASALRSRVVPLKSSPPWQLYCSQTRRQDTAASSSQVVQNYGASAPSLNYGLNNTPCSLFSPLDNHKAQFTIR